MPDIPILGTALLVLGACFALTNWMYLVQTWYTGRFHSCVPLIGAVFLALGASLIPATRPYAWAAILLDYGTLIIIPAIPFIAAEVWKTSRFNLLEKYIAQRGNKTVTLQLFRKGVFTIQQDILRPEGECGITHCGNIGTWEREQDRLLLRIGEECAVFNSLPEELSEVWRQSAGFAAYESYPELSLEGISFLSKAP